MIRFGNKCAGNKVPPMGNVYTGVLGFLYLILIWNLQRHKIIDLHFVRPLRAAFAIKRQRDICGRSQLEEAIRRMTSLPAKTFGLVGRGNLFPGYWADIVIFDPASIKDKATYQNPFDAPEGIAYVLVNGAIVLEHSQVRSLNSGQVIKAANSGSE